MIHISKVKIRNFKSFKLVNIDLPRSFVCLAGPNGSGKCVDGDTEVLLSDGTNEKIRDLVDHALADGHVEEMEDGYVAQAHAPKEILTLDTKSLKITKRTIAAFVKRKTPARMLRVKTRSGKEIVATEYHPFFILDGGQIRPIRADELKEKIRIAIPRRAPVEPQEPFFLEFLDLINPDDKIYVPYDEKIAGIIQSKKAGTTWEALEGNLQLPKTALTCFVNMQQAIKFPYLVRTLRRFGFSDIEIAQMITEVKGDGAGSILRMPWQNSNELCRFLGYLLADGSTSMHNNQIRFTNGTEEVVQDFARITKDVFHVEPHIYKYKENACDVIINNIALRNLLLKFGMSFEGAGGKYISELLLKHSTNEHLSNLLNGLFCGDGYVSKNTVELTLKSDRLISGVESILLRLGVVPRKARVSKRETRTGFVGSYLKLTISEIENMALFEQNVKMVHKKKSERLRRLVQKKINPNVDLIEANSMVRTAVSDLGISVKKMKKEFPRLDAYCYDQCLPSRYGIKHLLANAIRPVALQKQIRSEAVARLETLSQSDIFWDEVESIEAVAPKEEWVYDLSIGEHHNFIANGVIVHNSNFGDSIRFVMGEISLKALRAKKVRDLIHTGARTAEVTIEFDGDTKLELKRVIREDGKILYRLNGKKTTRNAILDCMKKYNLDESGRNIIAQGEVARIINMGGKERRTIIDSVAGISDFESKKKESIGELDIVESRIKDASIILGERQAILNQLEQEKEAALRFMDAKKRLSSARGTLLKGELTRLEKELADAAKLEEKIRFNMGAREKDHAELDARIAAVEAQRYQTNRELVERQQTSTIIRRIEELKASASSKIQMSKDKEESVAKANEDADGISKGIGKEGDELKSLDADVGRMKDELKSLETAAAAQAALIRNEEVDSLRTSLAQASENVQGLKEKLASLKSEMESKREIMAMKKDEAGRIAPEAPAAEASDKEVDSLRKAARGIGDDIDASFTRTKEINEEVRELDRKLLELNEAKTVHKVRASPQLANPALQFIAAMREKDGDGIHGTVADLIQFEPKHAQAVEACGGSRLLYVVVDDIDTATRAIDRLKKAKAGRATFIPINDVRVSAAAKHDGFDSVLDVISCPAHVRRAMEYVFGETLLVDGADDAKRIGVGKHRMVTMDGEIFERSGIVSGGRQDSSLLGNSQLKKIETQLEAVKTAKASLIQELYSIRQAEQDMRARKSELELKMKTLEMELRRHEEDNARLRDELKRRDAILTEMDELDALLKAKADEMASLASQIEAGQGKMLELRTKLEAAEKKFESASAEAGRKRTEFASKVSSLRATIEGKSKELEIRKGELRSKEKRVKELEKEAKDAIARINELKRQAVGEQEELLKLEDKVSGISKESEKLMEKMKNLEKEITELSRQRAEKKLELDKFGKDMGQLDVRKATAATRLEDIRAEFVKYQDAELLDGVKKDELNAMISEAETLIDSMPNVNMAAIEMYGRKKAEIEGVEEKINKLGDERKSILDMINEIEQHKKDAFFKTFYSVSENFKKMFTYLKIGEGYLYMDKPNEPFESGLYIKIRRAGKDGKIVEHSIDSLSGGENSLVALMFIFAMQFFKPSPFYILDEVDAALDKENSKNLSQLVSGMAADTQFMVVSHNDIVMSSAETVLGVAKVGGESRIVGVKFDKRSEHVQTTDKPVKK
jgi:chromosome segregation protein